MPAPQPKGPFCQSCSMPLNSPDDFGTDRAGFRVNDFCRHCYADDAFTEPQISMESMIDRGVAVMRDRGIMPEAQARQLLTDVMPRLKRWRVATHPVAATPF